jgi:hypothetical protein
MGRCGRNSFDALPVRFHTDRIITDAIVQDIAC